MIALLLLIFSSLVGAAEPSTNVNLVCSIAQSYSNYKAGDLQSEDNVILKLLQGIPKKSNYDLRSDHNYFTYTHNKIVSKIDRAFQTSPSCDLYIKSYKAIGNEIIKIIDKIRVATQPDTSLLLAARFKILLYFSLLQSSLLHNLQEGMGDTSVHLRPIAPCFENEWTREELKQLLVSQQDLLYKMNTDFYGLPKYGDSYKMLQDLSDLYLKKAQQDLLLEPAKLIGIATVSLVAWEFMAIRLATLPAITVGTNTISAATTAKILMVGMGAVSGAMVGLDFAEGQTKLKALTANEIQQTLEQSIALTKLPLNSPDVYIRYLEIIQQQEMKFSNYVFKVLFKINEEIGLEKTINNCNKLEKEKT